MDDFIGKDLKRKYHYNIYNKSYTIKWQKILTCFLEGNQR